MNLISSFSFPCLQELQHEVSSLLEFRDALLETFPHLTGRLLQDPNLVRRAQQQQQQQGDLLASPGHGAPRQQQQQHLQVHNSRPPGTTAGVIQRPDSVSDEVVGSWNGAMGGGSSLQAAGAAGTTSSTSGGTAPRRRTGGGSGAGGTSGDSGFCTSEQQQLMHLTQLHHHQQQQQQLSPKHPLAAYPQFGMEQQQQQLQAWDGTSPYIPSSPPGAAVNPQDELLALLDVIHRKTVRLRKDMDSRSAIDQLAAAVGHPQQQQQQPLSLTSQQQLGAISEGSELGHPHQTAAGGGIVHSVQIRTGGGASGSSGSDGDVGETAAGAALGAEQQHLVNIEIKPQPRYHARGYHLHRQHSSSSGGGKGVSVVSLKGGGNSSADNLLPQHRIGSGGRSRSFSNLAAGQAGGAGPGTGAGSRPPKVRLPPGARSQLLAPPSGGGGGGNSKSRSVENLVVGPGGGAPVLGLKPANSEMNMLRRATSTRHLQQQAALMAGTPEGRSQQQRQQRLKGATSELQVISAPFLTIICFFFQRQINTVPFPFQVDRLSAGEKVRLPDSVVEGILSLPAELRPPSAPGASGAAGLLSGVRPDRARIGRILRTDSVVDLQRQLLTTVMENEVYRTQLERVSDGWGRRVGQFERTNAGLREEVHRLRRENEGLRGGGNKVGQVFEESI